MNGCITTPSQRVLYFALRSPVRVTAILCGNIPLIISQRGSCVEPFRINQSLVWFALPYDCDKGRFVTNSFDVLQRGAAESGIVLGERALGQFERYFDLLMDWNTRVNLTSVTARAEVESRHFLDSLAVARAVPVEALASARIADVGSGAGFPGMPLAIVFPGSSVTLMEATSKKTRFLSALIESLELSNVTVLAGRAEELAHREDLRESFDLVLARAVAGLRSLA
ncbi:MAG: 16S rRNA (guanine(527)-N(7))-methyltransferase RsmG, partial [SAR202 cluster bacterium]|nr:16S rRNA (guanine(527)-N(7))-methyltransferase RsmG [SAR202 cluster bacterium]